MTVIIDDNEEIINNIKEIYKNCSSAKVRNLIEKHFTPTNEEKKKYAEVATPVFLVDEMLSKIPTDFWETPKKVFEPCCGKGNFVLGIFDKFYNGLEYITDEAERCRIIVEECIYYADISPLNIFITSELLKCHIKSYVGESSEIDNIDFKSHTGDTLILDVNSYWNIEEGFDAVIGNPPYQNSNGASNGTLWDKFVLQSFEITKTDGYICMVHPSGWRNVNGKFKKLQKEIFKKNVVYLEIHNESDGIITFKSETRYDWYIIQNNNDYTTTKIKFEDHKFMDINIRELEFIPNGQYYLVKDLLAKDGDEKCEVLYSRSNYGSDKKWINKIKDNEYKYPCVYTINSKSEIKYRYSSRNNGHIGIKKLMWSNGRIKSIGSVIDTEGKYGLTNFAYGIVDKEENLENIKKAFDSNKFRRLMEYCAVSQQTVNYKIIALFKKDFWKEFIDEE